MDSIALVQSLLLIVPGNSLAEDIQIEVAVIELEVLLGIADLTDEVSSILKRCGCSEQKLVVSLVQRIDVVSVAESAIHDQLGLAVSEDIQLTDQLSYSLDVRDIPSKLPVVERKTRLLTEQYGKIDLRQMIPVLVLAVLDLTESLGITGNRCCVVCPVFLLGSTFALKAEELHLLFLRDALEQFTEPLRGNIFAVRMAVELSPLAEPVQGVLIFEDQIICY